MKTVAVVYKRHGAPLEVAELDTIDLGDPAADEAIVQIEASPIHMADLFYMEGRLSSLAPPPPAIAGIEAVGRIAQIGADGGFEEGDRVFLPRRGGTFSQYVKVKTAKLTKAVNHGDPVQLSLMPINGATSYVMMTRVVDLKPGEWVLQNAANSSCGRFNISIAKRLGLKTVNVVRREELIPDLLALGADKVLLDGDGLSERVAEATGGAKIRYGIDAVAGTATQRMAESLDVGGVLAVYGMMSGQPCSVVGDLFLTRDLTLRGFCTPFFEVHMPESERLQMMSSLANWAADGLLNAKIAATYPLSDFADAMRHEMESGSARDGKVVILPNPELIAGAAGAR